MKNIVHLVPEKDKVEHFLEVNCWCNPTVELIANGARVTHNPAEDKLFTKYEIWSTNERKDI